MSEVRCSVCGAVEDEGDVCRCTGCGEYICVECQVWCCEEYDEANGDWFCEDCVENEIDENEVDDEQHN